MTDILGSWIDGVAGTTVPFDDRGLQYGDGIFETILVRNGVPRFLAAHRERMRRGLVQLGIQFLASQDLEHEIARAAAMAPPLAVLKIIITRGSAARRGYRPPERPQARRIMSLWQAVPLTNDLVEQGAILSVARLRLPTPSPFAGLKHLNRLENVMATWDAFFDALMLDTSEQLVSGTSCNVFLVKSGQVLTPPVNRVGVAGVMREIVLREAPRLGIATHERELTMNDLNGADGIFITNARIGVVPVQRVREHVFAMTDIACSLRAHIEALDA